MASGPSIVVKVLGDLTGFHKAIDDSSSKVQAAAGKMSSVFSTALSGISQTGALGPFQGAINGVISGLDAVSQHGKSAALAMGGVGAAIAGIGIGLGQVASRQQAASQQLQDAIAGTGKSYDDYSDRIDAAGKHNEKFGYSIAQTDDALKILTQATGDPEKALQALETATRLAAAKHEDLSTAAMQLGRVYNGSGRILKEFGLQIVPTVANATKELQTATTAAASADASLASARDTLNGAEQTAATAAKTLTDARKKLADQEEQVQEVLTKSGQYARDLANAQVTLQQSSESLVIAQSSLLDVQQKLYDIQHGTGQYALDQAHAELALDHAHQTVADSANNLAKAHQDLATAQRGLDPQKVVDAQLNLQQAQLSAKDASLGVVDAQVNLKKITDQAIPGTRAYNDLQHQLISAQLGVAAAANSQQDAQAKVNSLVNEATPGTKEYADMMDKLHDAQQAVSDAAKANADAQQKMVDAQGRYNDAVTKAAGAHDKLKKAQDDMKTAMTGNMAVIDQLHDKLGPQDEAAANTFAGHMRKIKAQLTDTFAGWGKWSGLITAIGSGLTGLAALWLIVAAAEWAAVWPVLVAGVVIAALIAIGWVIYHNWNTIWRDIKQWVGDAWQILQDAWHWIEKNWPLLLAILTGPFGLAIWLIVHYWSDLIDFFKKIPGWLVDALKDVGRILLDPFIWGLNMIVRAYNDTLGKLPFMPTIHEFKNPFDQAPKSIPSGGGGSPQYRLLQSGGIVTSPTFALLGEAGPEAVVPLGHGGLGPAIHIQHAYFNDGADIDVLTSKAAFAQLSRKL